MSVSKDLTLMLPELNENQLRWLERYIDELIKEEGGK